MLNGLKGFALGAALTAFALLMLPGSAERKLRKNTRAMRRCGTEAIDWLGDLL